MEAFKMQLELARLQLESFKSLCSKQEKTIDILERSLDNHLTHIEGLENTIKGLI